MGSYSSLKRYVPSRHKKNGKNKYTLLIGKKKPIWKRYVVYCYSYVTFWKRQNIEDSKMPSGCRELTKGRTWTCRAQRKSEAVKILCVVPWWWMHVANFSNPWMYNTELMLICIMDLGWVWRVGDVDNGGRDACVRVGGTEGISVLSQVHCES